MPQTAEYKRNYYLTKKEKYHNRYIKNRKVRILYAIKWQKAHPDRVKEIGKKCYKKRYQPHPREKETLEHKRERKRKANQKRKVQLLIQLKDWRTKNRQRLKEIRDNRKRGLGHIELNNQFGGSQGHHLDRNFVVYIPRELHQSVRHSVLRNRNMAEINNKVYEWLGYIPLP